MRNRHVKEPFRVVLLLQDLFFGGTQRHTLELARGLNPARFQTEIWVMRSGDDFVPLARRWNLSLTWLGRSPFVGPDSLVRLGWNLKNRPVDLLVLIDRRSQYLGPFTGPFDQSAAHCRHLAGNRLPRK